MKNLFHNNYLIIGAFCSIAIALELLRMPLYGGTFSVILSNPFGDYNFADIFFGFLVLVGDSLLLSLPALCVRKHRGIIFAWIALVDVFCLIQTCYIAVYHDFMPFSHFLLWENVNGTLLGSVIGLISPRDLVIFLPLAIYAALSFKIKETKKYNWKAWVVIPSIALCCYAAVAAYNINKVENDEYSLFQPYTTSYKAGGYVCDNGLIPYAVFSFVNTVTPQSLSEDERKQIDDYIATSPKYTDNSFAHKERKNLIVIVVESLNSWLLERSVCGMEITPNINALLQKEGTVSALKILPQVKDGRSGDGHFIINTGLLPLSSGAVSTSYPENTFPSLSKALKRHGYTSFTMVCDNAAAWNQEGMRRAMGFDTIYDSSIEGPDADVINDSTMLANALRVLKNQSKPFYAQLVTISTHSPGYAPTKPTTLSDHPTKQSRVINAMEDFHILDAQIGVFLEGLKSAGLFDDTIIVIVSDHNEVDFNEFEARDTRKTSDTFCSFIAINSTKTLSYDKVIGQVDIYPTLLDLTGVNDYDWKGLGLSILRNPQPDCAAYCDGTIIGNTASPQAHRSLNAWSISSKIIKGDYFKNRKEK